MQSLLKNIAREIRRALRFGDIGVQGGLAQKGASCLCLYVRVGISGSDLAAFIKALRSDSFALAGVFFGSRPAFTDALRFCWHDE